MAGRESGRQVGIESNDGMQQLTPQQLAAFQAQGSPTTQLQMQSNPNGGFNPYTDEQINQMASQYQPDYVHTFPAGYQSHSISSHPIAQAILGGALGLFVPPLMGAMFPGAAAGAGSAFGSTGGIGEGLGQLPTVSGALGVPGTTGVQAAAGMGGGIMDAFNGMGQIGGSASGMGGGAIYPSSVIQTIGANGGPISSLNTYGGGPSSASGVENSVMANFSPSASPTASFSQSMGSSTPQAVASGGNGMGAMGAFPSLNIDPSVMSHQGNELGQISQSQGQGVGTGQGAIASAGMGQGAGNGVSGGSGAPSGAQQQGGLGALVASLAGEPINSAFQNLMGNNGIGPGNAMGPGNGMGQGNPMDRFKVPQQQNQQMPPFGAPNVIPTMPFSSMQFDSDQPGMYSRLRKLQDLQQQNEQIQQVGGKSDSPVGAGGQVGGK